MIAELNGTRIYLESMGEGKPMLVMHGGLGWDHTYLRALDALAGEMRVIYYDHRGNGRSGSDMAWDGIGHHTWVEDAEELRRHLGIDRMILFGHSYGGFLALEYALRYPDRLEGLILCCTSPSMAHAGVSIEVARARATPTQFDGIMTAFSRPMESDEALGEVMGTILPVYFHRPDMLNGLFDRVRYSAGASNHAFGRCVPGYDVLPRLSRIAVPTLVLGGAHDWIMPPSETADLLHHGIAGSVLEVFRDSGHFPFVEEPEAFLRTVRDWFSTMTASG